MLTYSGLALACCVVVGGGGGGTTRLKLLKLAVGVGTGWWWCRSGSRLRRDLVREESLEGTPASGLAAAPGDVCGWARWGWPAPPPVDCSSDDVELSCRCLGCGMGLFFEGVSVGDGEGDETRGAAWQAGTVLSAVFGTSLRKNGGENSFFAIPWQLHL